MKMTILLGPAFRGRTKNSFIKEMKTLWDILEDEGLDCVSGFECYAEEPIKIKKIVRI